MSELWFDADTGELLTVEDIVLEHYSPWLDARWNGFERLNMIWALSRTETLEGFWKSFSWLITDIPEGCTLQDCIDDVWGGALHRIRNANQFRIEVIPQCSKT